MHVAPTISAFSDSGHCAWRRSLPPQAKTNGANGKRSVADTLAAGPASFLELMSAAGSRDGREIVHELDTLYAADKLTRNETGRYMLKGR